MKHIELVSVLALFVGLTLTSCSSHKDMSKISDDSRLPALTAQEKAYPFTKIEPGPECQMVGGYFGYDLPCGGGWTTVPDSVQFAYIRRQITNVGGNYGVIDGVAGSWYKGRIFKCPESAQPAAKK
jgi:hypothetical protein